MSVRACVVIEVDNLRKGWSVMPIRDMMFYSPIYIYIYICVCVCVCVLVSKGLTGKSVLFTKSNSGIPVR